MYLSFALPDLVGAIALAYLASHWLHFLYGSFVLLVFAEAILFAAVRGCGDARDPRPDRARRSRIRHARLARGRSRASGASRCRSRARVLIAALVLVFAFTLGDLSTTQVLLPVNLYTLGTEFNTNSSTVAFAAAAPFAAVLIALAMVAAYVLMSRFGNVRALVTAERWPSCACRDIRKVLRRARRARRRRPHRAGGHADRDPRRIRERQDDAASHRDRVHRRRSEVRSRSAARSSRTPASVHVPPDKRAIGYVAQEGALFPHLTVAQNVGFGLPRARTQAWQPNRRGARARRARSWLRRSAAARALGRRAAPGRARPRPGAAPGAGPPR